MKKIKTFAVWCLISFAAMPLAVNASSDLPKDEIILYLGEMQALAVSSPTRIVIGNPSIADVLKVTKEEVTLSDKAVGSTTLMLYDNFGEQAYGVKVYQENMVEIKRRVDNLLKQLDMPTVTAEAADDEAKVILTGTLKTKEALERLTKTMEILKGKIMNLVVVKEVETGIEVAVQVIELSKDASTVLGFSAPKQLHLTEVGSPGIATTQLEQVGSMDLAQEVTTGGTNLGNIWRIFGFNRAAFEFTLDALAQEGKARVLSRPRLLCQSGKEAELMVGGEKPVFTTMVEGGVGSTSTTVSYKEFGIKLKIKPTVTEDRRIKIVLNVEVSEIGTADVIGLATAPTAKAYPLSKRTISTELYLDDNQTMAISGLMKQKEEEDISKTALLGDIPVLGALFRQKNKKSGGGAGERGNMELYVTLTPSIIDAIARTVPKDDGQAQGKEAQAPAPVPSKPVPVVLREYTGIVQKHIVENIKYPASARNSGFQGTVTLKLQLSYNGELLESAIKTSSGYKVLDENALTVAKSIGTYPPFPPTIAQQDIWLEVPIVYSLE